MANTVYNNKVIEAKAKDLLLTKVNARSMMTIDTSLTQNAGMVKTINTYTYTGTAEEVARQRRGERQSHPLLLVVEV